ncbi:MAG: hypothetical protein LBP22_02320 [Deltaproteobacteria bacterium]|nr:hypothetical protein [Deltaproteobacteria bacterium]
MNRKVCSCSNRRHSAASMERRSLRYSQVPGGKQPATAPPQAGLPDGPDGQSFPRLPVPGSGPEPAGEQLL